MSDSQRGPGWWIASDGRWYPPELHPNYRPPPPPPPAPRPPPTVVARPAEPTAVLPSERPETVELVSAAPVVRTRRTLWSDIGGLWRERRGFRIAVVGGAVIVLLTAVGLLAGGKKDQPTKLLTRVPTTAVATTTVAVTTTVAAATTTSTTPSTTTTTTPPTTTTVVVRTTLAPATTATSPAAPAAGVFYANCTAARAAGAAPLRRGDPGYRSALDADNDGIACE